MSNVTNFDPMTLAEKLRERIRTSFVDLIPDETWKAMVEKEIQSFTTQERNYSGNHPSPLQALIASIAKDEIKKRIESQVLALLTTPEYSDHWDSGTQKAGAVVEAYLKSIVPELVTTMFTGIASNAVNHLRSAMQNGRF